MGLEAEMKNKGFSSLLDVMIYAFILVLSFTAIMLYSSSHHATSIKNLKYEAENRYAAQALESLSYLTIDGDGYQTVQAGTLEPVTDEDLKLLYNISDAIRRYGANLDNRLKNWSRNLTTLKEDIEDVKDNIEGIQYRISDAKELVDDTTERINTLPTRCYELLNDVNTYGQLIGGITLNDSSPCAQVENLAAQVTESASQVNTGLSNANDSLEAVIEKIDNYSDDETLLESIQQARCLIREVNIKLDNYVSYAELGVKQNATLIDLLPVRARMQTAPLTMIAGESLYVEDRLAQSDYLRAGGAMAAKIGLQYFNLSGGNETAGEGEKGTHEGNTSTLSLNATECHICMMYCEECNATTRECMNCDKCTSCDHTYDVDDLYILFNWSEHEVEIEKISTFTLCDNCSDCGDTPWMCNDCDRCFNEYKITHINTTGNETENNQTNVTIEDSKSRIIQAVILTLGRKDYRQITEEQAKKALDTYLTDKGYHYYFKIETCCKQMNRITIGNYTRIPDDAGHARKSLQIPDGTEATMDLYIWRG
jgi:archaellum component FlaC